MSTQTKNQVSQAEMDASVANIKARWSLAVRTRPSDRPTGPLRIFGYNILGICEKKAVQMEPEEISDEFRNLQQKDLFIRRKLPWIAGAVAVLGAACAAVLSLPALPAAMTVLFYALAGGVSTLLVGSTPQEFYEARMIQLAAGNKDKTALAGVRRGDGNDDGSTLGARALQQKFDAAVSMVEDGMPQEIGVKGPLRLKRKAPPAV